jgi:hypothetical protein
MSKLHRVEAGYYTFSTLAHDYCVERTESAFDDDDWWTLKRLDPQGFGIILSEADTLREMRGYLALVDVDRLKP